MLTCVFAHKLWMAIYVFWKFLLYTPLHVRDYRSIIIGDVTVDVLELLRAES